MNPLAPYLLWIKLGLLVLFLALSGLFAYKVNSWRQDSLALSGVRQEMSELKAAQAASQKASEQYQDELANLRSTRKPAPDVRLCRSPKQMPKAQPGHNDPAPGAGELPQEDGRNLGPDLYGLADEADELAARLRACQALLR